MGAASAYSDCVSKEEARVIASKHWDSLNLIYKTSQEKEFVLDRVRLEADEFWYTVFFSTRGETESWGYYVECSGRVIDFDCFRMGSYCRYKSGELVPQKVLNK
jgi:hypothetical protein